jgi:hypothetical protein
MLQSKRQEGGRNFRLSKFRFRFRIAKWTMRGWWLVMMMMRQHHQQAGSSSSKPQTSMSRATYSTRVVGVGVGVGAYAT